MPMVSGRKSDPEELSLARDAAGTQPSFLHVRRLKIYSIAREKNTGALLLLRFPLFTIRCLLFHFPSSSSCPMALVAKGGFFLPPTRLHEAVGKRSLERPRW